jgi:hypothetical protein
MGKALLKVPSALIRKKPLLCKCQASRVRPLSAENTPPPKGHILPCFNNRNEKETTNMRIGRPSLYTQRHTHTHSHSHPDRETKRERDGGKKQSGTLESTMSKGKLPAGRFTATRAAANTRSSPRWHFIVFPTRVRSCYLLVADSYILYADS